MSLRAIAAELNRRRLTTRRGSHWRMEYVARLLKDRLANNPNALAESLYTIDYIRLLPICILV